ncbi:hypothetical protein F5Y11DRAFT_225755 [Daldinia sp. FL1419]|nr:hypothetical protein F5Y11DRAFT_225755 [Daldinia sp. FL1419]
MAEQIELQDTRQVERMKQDLIQTLFNRNVNRHHLSEYKGYFDTFNEQTQYLNDYRVFKELRVVLEWEQLATIALIAVPQMCRQPDARQEWILDHLRRNIPEDSEGLRLLVGDTETQKDALSYSLDSVIRVWLMVNPAPISDSRQRTQGWRGERRLCDFVHGLFYPGRPAPRHPTQQAQGYDSELLAEFSAENTQIQSGLTHPLTAANMKKLTNININWVSLLDNHLEFDVDTRHLSIFPHNRWLIDAASWVRSWRDEQASLNETPDAVENPGQQDNYPNPQLCPFPIPLEVIEETIRSLDLLFPRFNSPTNRFLEKYNNDLYLFRLVSHDIDQDRASRKVRLREFTFYHDRLIEVAHEFITPPKDWNTIFRDYRNPIQYWTFWIGLVIFIATVISLGLAAAQVYYAQHPVTSG